MALTPSPFHQAVAGRGRPPRLLAVPDGALLLDCRPVWRRGAIGTLVVVALLLLVAICIFTLVVGPSESLLALLGMLWLTPWLALTAGNGLSRKVRTCREMFRHELRRRATRRRLRHTEILAGSLGTVAGGWIHVRGRVLAGPGFVSASGREQCVLACYAGLVGGRENREGQAEVHAMPSCLLLVGTIVVEVVLDGARFLEQPLRVAERMHEERIAVGDEVEVLGNLVRTIDHRGGGYRTPRLKLVLGGDDRHPLVVRPASP